MEREWAWWMHITFPRLVRGPSWRTRACRIAGSATQPGHHPGHPTAVGGLPASKPGLDAGAHDRLAAYRMATSRCQLAGGYAWTGKNTDGDVQFDTLDQRRRL